MAVDSVSVSKNSRTPHAAQSSDLSTIEPVAALTGLRFPFGFPTLPKEWKAAGRFCAERDLYVLELERQRDAARVDANGESGDGADEHQVIESLTDFFNTQVHEE
jgi:hypothetical protein